MTTISSRVAAAGQERLLALLAALVAVSLWASAFVGIRSAGRTFAPGALALARLLVGAVALGAVVAVRRESLPPRRSLPRLIGCGLLWFGLYNLALNEAERHVDAGTASMLVNIGPLLIVGLAAAFLGEGLPGRVLSGCLVSFAGVALIGVASAEHGLQAAWGAVLCLIAALAYAGGVILQKPALDQASALTVTWLACTVGAVTCLPYAASLVRGMAAAPASAIAWTVYLGLAPTAIGFGAWAYALAKTSAGRMGATTYLVPPLAVLFGWLILGEVPPVLAIPGGLLCLAGVARARRGPATQAAKLVSSRSAAGPGQKLDVRSS
ncbi:MAG: DMT family transporter [Solirubrobacterales bacterium]|nr:DMT family transporter [Solirubrobacterales bacterium]MBV9918501.1 DMT family transporter [Solirubrobacterales bacterium]